MSVKWVPGIWPYCAATHFTNSKWAHNPTPVNICLIWNMMDQSGIYFAHATPAQLVWHVQNCDWIGLLVSESEPGLGSIPILQFQFQFQFRHFQILQFQFQFQFQSLQFQFQFQFQIFNFNSNSNSNSGHKVEPICRVNTYRYYYC